MKRRKANLVSTLRDGLRLAALKTRTAEAAGRDIQWRLDDATRLLIKLNAKCDELHVALSRQKDVIVHQKKLIKILVDVIETKPAATK